MVRSERTTSGVCCITGVMCVVHRGVVVWSHCSVCWVTRVTSRVVVMICPHMMMVLYMMVVIGLGVMMVIRSNMMVILRVVVRARPRVVMVIRLSVMVMMVV